MLQPKSFDINKSVQVIKIAPSLIIISKFDLHKLNIPSCNENMAKKRGKQGEKEKKGSKSTKPTL